MSFFMNTSQETSLEDYKKFWTTPLTASLLADSAPTLPATKMLAWLLSFDASYRAGSSQSSFDSLSSSASSQPAQQQTPGERGLSALHFISLFWDRDVTLPQYVKALDSWCASVVRLPKPDDVVWHVTDEIVPALNAPFAAPIWNFIELCCGSRARPHGVLLLKNSLNRKSFDNTQCVKDIVDYLDNRASDRSLFLLSQFIRTLLSNSLGNRQHLCEELQGVLQARSIWPEYGKATEEMVYSLLKKELICPGSSHRELLLERVNACNDKTAAIRLFVERSNTDSEYFLGMLSMWKPREYSAHVMTASALALLLSKELNIPSDMVGVHFVPPSALTRLWQAANKIMNDSLLFSSEKEAAEYRRAALINLYGELQQALTPQLHLSDSEGNAIELLDESELDANGHNYATTQLFIPEQEPTATPWNITTNNETQKLLESLSNKRRHQIVVVGNDALLRSLASTYLCFVNSQPDAAKVPDIVFYVIPSPSCALGTLLADEDEWYSMHVVESLRYLRSVFPQLPAESSKYIISEKAALTKRSTETFPRAKGITPKDCANPPLFLTSVLDSFLTDAQLVLKLPMTLCQCWDMQKKFCKSYVFLGDCVISESGKQSFFCMCNYNVIGDSRVCHEKKKFESIVTKRNLTNGSDFCMECFFRSDENNRGKGIGRQFITDLDVALDESSLSAGRSLSVTVDGQSAGPYAKARIIQVPYSFPVAHFIPLQK